MKKQFTSKKIRLIAMLLVVVSLLSNLSVTAFAASSTRSYIANGEYSIRLHDDTSKCVNVLFASTAEDRAEIVVDPWNSQSNEIWIITNRGSNYYTISPKHAPHLCLNALLANKTPGDKATLHRYTANDAASLWSFHYNSDGSYTLKNKATGLVLDLTNGNYATGNRFIHWTSNNYLRAQGFFLRKISSSSASSSKQPIANGYYTVTSQNSKLGWNVQYAPKSGIGSMVLDPVSNNEGNEIFWVEYVASKGAYYITPVYRKGEAAVNCLYGASAKSGSQVKLHPSNTADTASLWYITKVGSYYTFKNVASGMYAITQSNYTYTGLPIVMGNGYALSQRYFKLNSVSESVASKHLSLTWASPLRGNVRTTQSFGSSGHLGIDMVSSNNKNIYAAAKGTVYAVGCNGTWQDAYTITYESGNGYYVVLEHTVGNKKVYTMYGHMKSKSTLKVGQAVDTNTVLGVIGNTGNSRGEHLHFAIANSPRNGSYYGYTSNYAKFSANSKYESRTGITFYNPTYVINNNKLPG